MRKIAITLLCLGACTNDANHLGSPLLWPVAAVSTAAENAAYNERRGRVEVFVKTNHPQLLDEIATGGGPLLTQAMNIAGVPGSDRAARVIQIQGDLDLFRQSPEALVVSLMVYGQ